MNLQDVHKRLAAIGIETEKGLSDREIEELQRKYDFIFVPDLREFLQIALPISTKWMNWRGDEYLIRERLGLPLDGILFDIEHNDFWLDTWGTKPANLGEAFNIARQKVAEAPVLIPIFAHRYIPASPLKKGNPVFSVHQTDIIYYGSDLIDYLGHEFLNAGDKIDTSNRDFGLWSVLIG